MKVWLTLIVLLQALMATTIVPAQDHPNKVIRIVAAEAGGSSDFAARLIAQGLGASSGQQVIVENRGGSAVIQAELVAKARPDGYTVLLNGSTIWLTPFLQDKVTYDPVRDFAPVTLATRSPNILVVHPSLPAKSVADLVALAKAKPGELNYGSGLAGGSNHLAAELFKSMAGVQIVRVTYKGTGPALTGLIGGEVQMMFAPASSVSAHVKSGRLKALAVTTAQPSALLPGLLPVAASGLPGYEAVSLLAIFAPAATPAAVVHALNQEIVRVINAPENKDKFFNAGIETVGSSPGELAATMKADMTRMGKVIKDAGIRAE